MGPALKTVTALELIIQFMPCKSMKHRKRPDATSMPDFMFDSLSQQTERAILAPLAAAMPDIVHLGVVDGMPSTFSHLFLYFKKISSIEQLVVQASNGSQETSGSFRMQDGACLRQNANSTVLSMFIWDSLPFALTTLTCDSLPRSAARKLCWSLRSLHLTRKPSHDMQHRNRLGVLELCDLLEDAPYLKSFSTSLARENIFHGAMCLPSHLTGMHILHQRIAEGGLVLGSAKGGVPVVCKCSYVTDEKPLLLSQLLSTLQDFSVCKLSLRFDEPAAGCVCNLARVFPGMETLILKGEWKIAELLLLSECTSLRRLVLSWNSHIAIDGFSRIALNMPWLSSLVLHGDSFSL